MVGDIIADSRATSPGIRSLTVWFTEAAIAAWKAEPRATRGGQPLSQFRAAPVKSSFSVSRSFCNHKYFGGSRGTR
jgi:hypothetical protein